MSRGETGGVGTRAVSTVLDASLCLLLVTASVVTLTGTPHLRETGRDVGPASADRTADLLATSTARVTYAVGGQSQSRRRTAHDTLAGLLASAARADAGASDTEPSTANATFVAAVVDRVSRTLRRVDPDAQVVARWPASRERSPPATGRVTVGRRPPRDADVHAARLVVDGVGFTVRTWSA